MSKPTPAEVKALFETDVSTDALQTVIDAQNAEVVSRYGAAASHLDDLAGGSAELFTSRRVNEVTSIIETIGDTDTTLAANDYEIRRGGWALRRLDTGTNQRGRWGTRIRVSYKPQADLRRKMVVIDLVKLTLQHQGLTVERAGDYRADLPNYQSAREAILRTLSTEQVAFA